MTHEERTEAREAIAALIFRYAERLDAGDLAGVAGLFEHATYRGSGGSVYRGAAAVRDVLSQRVIRYGDGTPRTKHVTTNLTIALDADGIEATARSYFTVFQQVDAAPLQAIVAGRYHDRFVRAAGEWRFAERLIHVDLVGDLSRHLR
jgi:3-phenylpropionate/cinnamic acid dioxygenase small subunit